jgi:hypothetical protein
MQAGALPIESVELSRTVRLWGLNIFLAYRAGVKEWFWRREVWEMRWLGVGAVECGEIRRSVMAAENRRRTQIRARLSEGCQ